MEKVAKKPSPEQLLRASQIPNTARQTLAMITPSRASIRAKSKLQGWTPERLELITFRVRSPILLELVEKSGSLRWSRSTIANLPDTLCTWIVFFVALDTALFL